MCETAIAFAVTATNTAPLRLLTVLDVSFCPRIVDDFMEIISGEIIGAHSLQRGVGL